MIPIFHNKRVSWESIMQVIRENGMTLDVTEAKEVSAFGPIEVVITDPTTRKSATAIPTHAHTSAAIACLLAGRPKVHTPPSEPDSLDAARGQYNRAKTQLDKASHALKDAERTLCYLVSERDRAEHMLGEAKRAFEDELYLKEPKS